MINQQVYLDKVHGGWFGKCLGGAAGAPVEGFKCLIETRHYTETLRTDLPNDDLDLQLLWLEVLQEKGF
ncbi:MAG: ADP-ribosylglycohydrolase family protein, partial [Ruthenibacterium sp.]